MITRTPFLLVALLLLLVTGCPESDNQGGDPNEMVPGGDMSGGDSMGDGDDGGDDDGGGGDDGGNDDGSGDDDGGGDDGDDGGGGDPAPSGLTLRSLSIDERAGILSLVGSFGDATGEVFVNGSARALAGGGWTATTIEVAINPLDTGEVYVQLGDAVSGSRWITAWDFSITRTQPHRLQSICGDCNWTATWNFRMRGDAQPVDFGGGVTTPGDAAGRGVRGASFTLDSVTGTYELSGETITLAAESVDPTYELEGDGFVLGGGEWFSTFAGIDQAAGEVVITVHVDTDGVRVTNLDTSDMHVEHINFFGVFAQRDYIHTLVVPLSPSLNVPGGTAGPDANGGMWEWQAAPVHSPPPPGT